MNKAKTTGNSLICAILITLNELMLLSSLKIKEISGFIQCRLKIFFFFLIYFFFFFPVIKKFNIVWIICCSQVSANVVTLLCLYNFFWVLYILTRVKPKKSWKHMNSWVQHTWSSKHFFKSQNVKIILWELVVYRLKAIIIFFFLSIPLSLSCLSCRNI